MSAYALNEQQQMLADSARHYLRQRATAGLGVAAAGRSGDESVRWSEMAELGWLAMPVPESFGGLGGSMADICALVEELGISGANEPYVASAVLAGMLLADIASDSLRKEWLPALAGGARRLALAVWEPEARFDWTHVTTQALQRGSDWHLAGSKVMVLGGAGAQGLVVSACIAGSQDLALFLLPAHGPGQRLLAQTLFDGQGAAELTMDDAKGAILLCRGDRSTMLSLLERAIDRATLAHCADTVGAMARAFELTRAYLGTRSQFGKPIAANQVVQHRLVDLYVEIEEARALMRKTASLYVNTDGESAPERRRHVAATKAFVAQAARHVWEETVQLHGAIGMTQECAVGAFVKRLALAVSLYGDEAFHLQRVAAVSFDDAALAARSPQETTSVPSR